MFSFQGLIPRGDCLGFLFTFRFVNPGWEAREGRLCSGNIAGELDGHILSKHTPLITANSPQRNTTKPNANISRNKFANINSGLVPRRCRKVENTSKKWLSFMIVVCKVDIYLPRILQDDSTSGKRRGEKSIKFSSILEARPGRSHFSLPCGLTAGRLEIWVGLLHKRRDSSQGTHCRRALVWRANNGFNSRIRWRGAVARFLPVLIYHRIVPTSQQKPPNIMVHLARNQEQQNADEKTVSNVNFTFMAGAVRCHSNAAPLCVPSPGGVVKLPWRKMSYWLSRGELTRNFRSKKGWMFARESVKKTSLPVFVIRCVSLSRVI